MGAPRRTAHLLLHGTALKRWPPAQGNGPGDNVATGFGQTGNIDVDAAGSIYVSDRNNHAIYRVSPSYGGGIFNDSQRVAGLGSALATDSNAASNGQLATQVGMREPRGVAFHPLGGYLVATHRGGDVWYVDSGGRAWMFMEGDGGNFNTSGGFAVPTTGVVITEPRSVTVSRTGDIVIAYSDAGFVRVVRNILPRPAAPAWMTPLSQPTGLNLRWQSDAARWYFLEQTPDLNAGAWSPLATLPGAGAFTDFTDAAALTGPRRFYRLRSFGAWPN